jgi:hypothetical protein
MQPAPTTSIWDGTVIAIPFWFVYSGYSLAEAVAPPEVTTMHVIISAIPGVIAGYVGWIQVKALIKHRGDTIALKREKLQMEFKLKQIGHDKFSHERYKSEDISDADDTP